eukprot:scaffold117791_cov59-Phaeocystis_antarctica.AAC.2
MSSTKTLLTTLALPWASSTAAHSGALSSSVAFCEFRATSPSSEAMSVASRAEMSVRRRRTFSGQPIIA